MFFKLQLYVIIRNTFKICGYIMNECKRMDKENIFQKWETKSSPDQNNWEHLVPA